MLQIIFLYYTLPVSKVIMSTRTDQYDTIRIMFLYRVANLPVHLRTHCTLGTLSSFWQGAHMLRLLSPSLSPHPLAHLASPACTQGRDREGGYACRWRKGGGFVSELPSHVCTENCPPECVETKGMSLEQPLSTDLSQSGHKQLLDRWELESFS